MLKGCLWEAGASAGRLDQRAGTDGGWSPLCALGRGGRKSLKTISENPWTLDNAWTGSPLWICGFLVIEVPHSSPKGDWAHEPCCVINVRQVPEHERKRDFQRRKTVVSESFITSLRTEDCAARTLCCTFFKHNEEVIKMTISGLSPSMRHVSWADLVV